MAARQTEACERGQVPALQKADQVAAPGMRGGTGAHVLQSCTRLSWGGQISAILQAGPCQARLQHPWAPTLCALPSKARYLGPGAFAGRQAPALQLHAKDTCSPLPEPCQVPLSQKGRTDARRGREPAARVQPSTAITVLLILRGFRMSEPSVPHQGQLGQGRAAIPGHVVDAPWCSLLQLAQGKRPHSLCQAAGKGNGQTPRTASQPCLLPDTLPALEQLLPTRDGHVPAWPMGRGRQEHYGQQAGEIYRSPSPTGMATQPPSAATEITHLIER